jgi:hypothetical protein
VNDEEKYVNVTRIKHFEKNKRYMVNVFYYDREKKQVYTLQKSTLNKGEYERVCNLLLIEDEKTQEKKHYLLIRDLSRFFKNIAGLDTKKKIYPCINCLNYFYNEDKLKEHQEVGCEDNEVQKTIMPKKDGKSNFVEFENYKKKIMQPFVIYADTESILKGIEKNEDDDSKTTKFQEHKNCSFACVMV